MRCSVFLDRYDGLDNGRRLGLALRIHLASCASCRAELLRHGRALEVYKNSSAYTEPDRFLEDKIMAAVRILPRPRRSVSLRDWVVTGGIIAVSIALIPLGESFDTFKALFGTRYSLPLALVLGLVLTSYGAVFIGSHMRELGSLVKRG